MKLPPLNEGETYIGCVGDKNGDAYHIILLPGDNEATTWFSQCAWAESIGGDLPNRAEMALLHMTHRNMFHPKTIYWTNEVYSDSALAQSFHPHHESGSFFRYYTQHSRARAVRRLPI